MIPMAIFNRRKVLNSDQLYILGPPDWCLSVSEVFRED